MTLLVVSFYLLPARLVFNYGAEAVSLFAASKKSADRKSAG
jgi:hypothetical protein